MNHFWNPYLKASRKEMLKTKKILVTGNTGFTGPWLVQALMAEGAIVGGFSLKPEFIVPPGFDAKNDDAAATFQVSGNVSDFEQLYEAFKEFSPDLVVHLAAQPIVSKAWETPLETFKTNALGTANVLECLRLTPSIEGCLIITTDKVYKNQEWPWPYRENDEILGLEPYAASKAAAEMIVEGYRSYSELSGKIAVARGGNIIGGGDWSPDRLIPDFVRAVITGTPLLARNLHAIRPWQHVLDLTAGYVEILRRFSQGEGRLAAQNWNFGPDNSARWTVGDVITSLQQDWKPVEVVVEQSKFKESNILTLDSTKAKMLLDWAPKLDTRESIQLTADWYREFISGSSSGTELIVEQYKAWLEK